MAIVEHMQKPAYQVQQTTNKFPADLKPAAEAAMKVGRLGDNRTKYLILLHQALQIHAGFDRLKTVICNALDRGCDPSVPVQYRPPKTSILAGFQRPSSLTCPIDPANGFRAAPSLHARP